MDQGSEQEVAEGVRPGEAEDACRDVVWAWGRSNWGLEDGSPDDFIGYVCEDSFDLFFCRFPVKDRSKGRVVITYQSKVVGDGGELRDDLLGRLLGAHVASEGFGLGAAFLCRPVSFLVTSQAVEGLMPAHNLACHVFFLARRQSLKLRASLRYS